MSPTPHEPTFSLPCHAGLSVLQELRTRVQAQEGASAADPANPWTLPGASPSLSTPPHQQRGFPMLPPLALFFSVKAFITALHSPLPEFIRSTSIGLCCGGRGSWGWAGLSVAASPGVSLLNR